MLESFRIKRLLTKINNKDESIRSKAVKSLGKINDPRVIEPLINALNDDAFIVRRFAIEALAKTGNSNFIEQLITILGDKFVAIQFDAANALSRLGDSRWEKAIRIDRLAIIHRGDKYGNQWISNMNNFIKIDDHRRVLPIIHALKNGDKEARSTVIKILALTNDQKVIKALIGVLGDREVGIEAACSFPIIKDVKITEMLTNVILGQDVVARCNAAITLGRLGCLHSIDPLIEILEDKTNNITIRRSAVSALGMIEDKKVIKFLVHALKEEDFQVRSNAAIGLGNFNDSQVVLPLLEALCDEVGYVRKKVAEALDKNVENKWINLIKGDNGDFVGISAIMNTLDLSVKDEVKGLLQRLVPPRTYGDDMCAHFKCSVEIAASKHGVWNILTDHNRWHEWYERIQSISLRCSPGLDKSEGKIS